MVGSNYILHSLLAFLASICRCSECQNHKTSERKDLRNHLFQSLYFMDQGDQDKAAWRGHVAYVWLGWDLRSSPVLVPCPREHGGARQRLSRHPGEGHPSSCSARCPSLRALYHYQPGAGKISRPFNGASHRASINREQEPREPFLDICIQNWIQSAQIFATISSVLFLPPFCWAQPSQRPRHKGGKKSGGGVGGGCMFCFMQK